MLPALPPELRPPGDAVGFSDEAALRAWLVPVVARMLANERARLLAVFYRVDVRERDLASALAADDVPAALADALIARMVEKQRFRNPNLS